MDPAQWPLKDQPRKFLRAKFTDAGRQGSKLKPGFVLISGKNHTHHRRTSHPLPPSSENRYSGENWYRGSFHTGQRAAGTTEGRLGNIPPPHGMPGAGVTATAEASLTVMMTECLP